MALSAGRMMFVRAVIMKWKYAETLSITSVEFEVELHTIANTVIVESEVIFERTFTLSLQHNLMRLTTNTCCNHGLECFCTKGQCLSRIASGHVKHLLTGSLPKQGIAAFVPKRSLTLTIIIGSARLGAATILGFFSFSLSLGLSSFLFSFLSSLPPPSRLGERLLSPPSL